MTRLVMQALRGGESTPRVPEGTQGPPCQPHRHWAVCTELGASDPAASPRDSWTQADAQGGAGSLEEVSQAPACHSSASTSLAVLGAHSLPYPRFTHSSTHSLIRLSCSFTPRASAYQQGLSYLFPPPPPPARLPLPLPSCTSASALFPSLDFKAFILFAILLRPLGYNVASRLLCPESLALDFHA